jgi:hypothetical protein
MGKNNKGSESTEVANTKLIKFTFSPTGAYGLGYFIGDVGEIESELADKIVANEHAEYVNESEVLVADSEPVIADEIPVVNADLISPEGAEAL